MPLNANGIAQAYAAAEALRGRGIATLVASPLNRARTTAEIAAAALGLALDIEDRLREVAFGGMEGQPMLPWFDAWVEGEATPAGAETFAELRARAVGTVNRLLQRPGPVLVVGHGAFFRALRAAMGLPPNVRLPNAMPLYCAPDGPTWRLLPA